MKILYVLEHYYPYIGGAEKLFRQLAESLSKNGHEVEVITTRFDKTLPQCEILNGVKVTRVECKNRFLFSVFALPTILRTAGKYDLIHTTTYNAALPAWIGGRIKRKKIILTFHEVWGKLWFKLPFANYLQKTLYFLFEWFIGRLSFDHYIAVSEYTKKSLLSIGKSESKITRIYNGLDYNRFSNYSWSPKSEVFEFVYFGRLGISKGLDIIIKAAGLMKDYQGRPFQIRLIIPKQPKPIFNALKNLIEKVGASHLIVMEHNLSDHELFSRIQTADCALIPSHSEGFCFTAAEACAIGIPIIHSGKGALEEVVSGSNLTFNGQSPSNLAKAMTHFLENDDVLTRPLSKFELSESVKQTMDLYGRIKP